MKKKLVRNEKIKKAVAEAKVTRKQTNKAKLEGILSRTKQYMEEYASKDKNVIEKTRQVS